MIHRTIALGSVFVLALGCSQTGSTDRQPTAAASAPAEAQAAAASAPAEAAAKVPARQGPLPIGAAIAMADVEMKNIDGQMMTLGGAKGDKGTLVVFTCNHCPYVKAWEGRIAELGNAAKKMGFGVVAINSNDPDRVAEDGFDQMQARASKLGLEFPYVVDATSNMARAYGASKTPEVFLFDAGDKLVYYGAVDDNYRDAAQVEQTYLKDALDAVANGQPVTKAVTKALGCSIKLRS